jgi:hypothetical protein
MQTIADECVFLGRLYPKSELLQPFGKAREPLVS